MENTGARLKLHSFGARARFEIGKQDAGGFQRPGVFYRTEFPWKDVQSPTHLRIEVEQAHDDGLGLTTEPRCYASERLSVIVAVGVLAQNDRIVTPVDSVGSNMV